MFLDDLKHTFGLVAGKRAYRGKSPQNIRAGMRSGKVIDEAIDDTGEGFRLSFDAGELTIDFRIDGNGLRTHTCKFICKT